MIFFFNVFSNKPCTKYILMTSGFSKLILFGILYDFIECETMTNYVSFAPFIAIEKKGKRRVTFVGIINPIDPKKLMSQLQLKRNEKV